MILAPQRSHRTDTPFPHTTPFRSSTWPRMTSDTSSGATPASPNAASIAMRPSSCAGVVAKLPRKLPTAVRLAAVITPSVLPSLPTPAVQLPPPCVRLRNPLCEPPPPPLLPPLPAPHPPTPHPHPTP